MIADVVVWSAAVLTVAFVAAWACSPGLRSWIERPKYRFFDSVQAYDRSLRRQPAKGRESRP